MELKAKEGMILTNGEVYGKEIYLSTTENPDNWYEITEAEYEEITKADNEPIE